ncbi:glycosyltransferase family 39 protein [Alicyclobacillus pomorum]
MQSLSQSNTESTSRRSLRTMAPRIAVAMVLLVALGLRLFALWRYGLSLNLHSDDAGYTQSAIRLLEYGRLTYHSLNEHTVHMMPGISLLLAAVFAVFGWHNIGLYAAKVVMILIGVAGIYATYLFGKEICYPWAGIVAAACTAVYVPEILTDNLLLTEPPFMASFMFLLYFSVRHARTRRWAAFAGMVASYVIALMFRPTVAAFPVVIVLYHLLKRYPFRSLMVRSTLWVLIICAVLCPWWIRNYHDYHKFIPLTAGTGDPMLLGTYQGEGYPNQVSEPQLIANIKAAHPGFTAYDLSMYEQAAAKSRLAKWWHDNPQSMLKSYLYLKPQRLWNDTFYWIKIFGVQIQTIHTWQPRIVTICFWGYLVGLLLRWKNKRDLLFVWATLLYYTALYSIYFVFGRYTEPLLPLVFLGAGTGLSAVIQTVARLCTLRVRESTP